MHQHQRQRRDTTLLAHSALTITITDLVAEYELRHAFRNGGENPIEAVYSFPVPLDSAFMGMQATLAGERRVAQVLPRTQANHDYDDALSDGNSAVLLERLEPGMLCVNLGNLKPGEEGEVVLRFAAPLQCADGAARFSLPLVHRPRYGRSRLEEWMEPRHDFAVEHSLEAVIHVQGMLAGAPVTCATHAARFSTTREGQQLRLSQAMLDRDLVLVFDLPEDFCGQAHLVRDGEDAIGVLTFNVPTDRASADPCDLCLVMDGSGSMGGDAIDQSRAALVAVAQALGEEDRVQVLRFGSTVVPMFRRPLKTSQRVRDALVELAGSIDADLGGTEIGLALERAMDALPGSGQAAGRSQAIILVTDGAVQPSEIEAVRERATGLGIRVFVVAVGSSAGADVLAPLAKSTRAVLERAVPAEPIDEVVMRQLRRAHAASPVTIEVDWDTADAKPLPVGIVYAGDACTAIAMLPGGRECRPVVYLGNDRNTRQFHLSRPQGAPALRALAGHAACQHAPEHMREAQALRYGLVTDATSAVLVKLRAENQKIEGMPMIVPVAHMLPEGMVASAAAPMLSARAPRHVAETDADCDYLDLPAFLRRDSDSSSTAEPSARRWPFFRHAVKAPATRRPEPAMLEALARALVHLLLDGEVVDATLAGVLERMDAKWHEQVVAYIADACPSGLNPHSTMALLEKLLVEVPNITLTDDQEARWACAMCEDELLG